MSGNRKNAFQTAIDAIGAAKLSTTGEGTETRTSIMTIAILEQIALNLAMQTDILSSISASAVLRMPPQTLNQRNTG